MPPRASLAAALLLALLLFSLAPGALAGNCTAQLPFLACYDDAKGPHAVPTALGEAESVADCVSRCGALGYRLSGLTGNAGPPPVAYCYCGSSVDGAAVQAPAADCSLPCPAGGGAGAPPCGGSYRLALYNSTCTGPMPPPPGPGLNGTACSQPESAAWAFCNKTLTVEERVADLVSRLTLYEIGPQLTARHSPAIPRLGIPSYYWGLNVVHGVTNPVDTGARWAASRQPKCARSTTSTGGPRHGLAWAWTPSFPGDRQSTCNASPLLRPDPRLRAQLPTHPSRSACDSHRPTRAQPSIPCR